MKVVGWTSWNNFDKYPNYVSSSNKEAVMAVAGTMMKRGYRFCGADHQFHDNCTPIFDDGTVFRASQRGWGSVMAIAYPKECGTDQFAYCRWSFKNPIEPVYPNKQGV